MINDPLDSYQCYNDLLARYYAAKAESHKWRWRTMTVMLVAIALTVALLAVAK